MPNVTVREGTVTVKAILDSNSYADYVFINGGDGQVGVSGATAGERIYILDFDGYETSQDADENEYYIYDAIINGEIGTVNVSEDSQSDITANGLYGYITYDSDGYVNSLQLIDDAGDDTLKAWNVGTTITYSAGVLSFEDESLVLDDDCVIFVNDDGDGTTTTASRLARDYDEDNAFDGVISAVYDNDVVIEVYVDEYSSIVTQETKDEVNTAVSGAIADAAEEGDGWGEDYAIAGGWTVDENDPFQVNASFGTDDLGENNINIMNDTARFLGSLHSNGDVREIVFNGVTYVWDNDGGLKGSNWYDASDDGLVVDDEDTTDIDEGNTLVNALVDWYTSHPTASEITLTVDGVNITITYTVE